VDIILHIIREIIIHHQLDIFDIQSTSGNIGGNKDLHTSFFEILEGPVTILDGIRGGRGKGRE